MTPSLVNHLILTSRFLIKGTLATGPQRLSQHLANSTRAFLGLEGVTMMDLRRGERTMAEHVSVRRNDVVLAHEFLDVSGDEHRRRPEDEDGPLRRVTFHLSVATPAELEGRVRWEALRSSWEGGFVVVREPSLGGLPEDLPTEMESLCRAPYLILNTSFVQCLLAHEHE